MLPSSRMKCKPDGCAGHSKPWLRYRFNNGAGWCHCTLDNIHRKHHLWQEGKSQGRETFTRLSWNTQGNSWLGCGVNERERKKGFHSLCIYWAEMWRYRVIKSVDGLKLEVVPPCLVWLMQHLGLETQTCSKGWKWDSFPPFITSSHGSGPCLSPVLMGMGLTAGPYPCERGFFKQFIEDRVGRLLSQGQWQACLFLGQLAWQQTFKSADALDGPERFLLAGQSDTQWV